MEHRDNTLKEMARVTTSTHTLVSLAVKEILNLVEAYKSYGKDFRFDIDPELESEVNRILITLSDKCLTEARERARAVLDWLPDEISADEIISEKEDEDEGLLWAFDMHASNLKRVLEAWIAIWFARGYSKERAYTEIMSWMNAPDASPMWREAVRARLVDPNEVRFGRGYQRNIQRALSVTIQSFLYAVFCIGYLENGKINGAIGYRTYRQSNYDCPLCDSLTETVWPLDTMVLPAHPNCVCGMELVYSE